MVLEGLDDHLDAVRRVAGHLWDKGWAERNAGNLSIDVTGSVTVPDLPASAGQVWRPLAQPFPELADRSLWIPATGARMRALARDPAAHSGVVRVSRDGASYLGVWTGSSEGSFEPASELPTHCAVHASLRRRGAPESAVLHTHPTELIALSHVRALWHERMLNRLLWSMHPETVVVVPEGLALVDYLLPGTLEQGRASAARFEDHRVVLWQKHGAVAVGQTLDEALDLVDTLNKSAAIHLACRAAGYVAEGLSDADVAALREAFHGWRQP